MGHLFKGVSWADLPGQVAHGVFDQNMDNRPRGGRGGHFSPACLTSVIMAGTLSLSRARLKRKKTNSREVACSTVPSIEVSLCLSFSAGLSVNTD